MGRESVVPAKFRRIRSKIRNDAIMAELPYIRRLAARAYRSAPCPFLRSTEDFVQAIVVELCDWIDRQPEPPEPWKIRSKAAFIQLDLLRKHNRFGRDKRSWTKKGENPPLFVCLDAASDPSDRES